MTSANKEIIEYVQSLDENDNKQVVQNFVDKLNTPIDWQLVLNRFNWSSSYFAELDDLLIKIGYCGRDDIIELIKEFLHTQLYTIGILEYNKIYNAGIWNHFDELLKYPYGINWNYLSRNPAAIDLLKQNPDKIDWDGLSMNTHPFAIALLKMNPEKIKWILLSGNIAAIELLKQNPDKIDWRFLSKNTAAMDLLEMNPNRIDWFSLSKNIAAADLLKMNTNKMDWAGLSSNTHPFAIALLKMNPEKICWFFLSNNINPDAIELLRQNPERIRWDCLSSNPAAIDLLRMNPEKIHWYELNTNPNSDAIDMIKTRTMIYYEALSYNKYDYFAEKLKHFNEAGHFPQSRLIL